MLLGVCLSAVCRAVRHPYHGLASMKRCVLPSQCTVEPEGKNPLEKRQESQQNQERQKLREAARLKLQKKEESVEYEDNIGVTNDFHKLSGDNYRISDGTSRDDFIWWNKKIKPSGFVQYSGCSFGMEGRQYSQLLQESQKRQEREKKRERLLGLSYRR
ncbi:hypothetical protein AKJ16_DCAP19671 [Drosera capensis]